MGEPEKLKNPAAVALGRLGASKGGKATAAKLSQQQRTRSASRAARARLAQMTPEQIRAQARRMAVRSVYARFGRLPEGVDPESVPAELRHLLPSSSS